ncbi:MAG TPA: hypothetical protein VN036_06720 [Devosia sp.]|nr:hypothetical protein [Devosia sp.]
MTLLRPSLEAAQGDAEQSKKLASVFIALRNLQELAEFIKNDSSLETYAASFPRRYISRLRSRITSAFEDCVTSINRLDGHADSELILRLSSISMYNTRLCNNTLDNRIFIIKEEQNPFVDLDAFVERIAKDVRDGVARYADTPHSAREIFQRIADKAGLSEPLSPTLPSEPPKGQLYAKRLNPSETAPQFIERVYGNWLTGEFTRADLRRLDKQAEMALRNWERTNGRASINLPTLKERNDALTADPTVLADPTVKEIRRLQSAAHRRKHQ